MNRKVISVFGGTGFVGRNLVNRLAISGAEIRVAARNFEVASLLKTSGDVGQIVPIQTDVTDIAQVANAVDGASEVINLAGILYPSGQQTFKSVHIEAARNVAQASAAAGVKRLVHISALGADLNSPSEYATSKAMGEKAVLENFKEAVIFRPSVIFGAEDSFFNTFASLMRFMPFMPVFGAPAIPNFSFDRQGGGLINFFGNGGCRFQPVFVCDITKAIIQALESIESMGLIYELGGPRIYSFKEIIELIYTVTGRKRVLIPIPYSVASVQAMFLQKLPKPLLTVDQVKLMQVDNIVSGIVPGFKELGISAKPAEAVLPTYLNRFRKSKHPNAQKAEG
ncbi:MAG: complex I NDUFA9 subunit family protein [Magnetovibrio sp.]|nr:complex I NDUFA9 subunit family protein [Magnetovibrio sp.]|tara:strand:- start:201 stop:1217 length:1017 start_codon:yes stop_codon:yes gene_type:complete